ncbi:MAG: hypothetical protein EOP51_34850, partial [Sphingobacteriales bacterium]
MLYTTNQLVEKEISLVPTPNVKAEINSDTVTTVPTPEIPVSLQTLVEKEMEIIAAKKSEKYAPQTGIIKMLLAENKVLALLKTRNDSLLKALEPEYFVATKVYDSSALRESASRWSVALAVAPELTFLRFSAPAADTAQELRRPQETGRAGANAAFLAGFQVTEKLRISAGIGYSTFGTELRLTNRETLVNILYDTTSSLTTASYTSSHTNYIVQEDSSALLDPIFNQNGQVIGYNTVYVTKPDTVWQTVTIEGTDTIRTQTITPLIHKTEKTAYRKLKPQYHFITLPVMLNYRLTAGQRWWAEAG